MKLLITLTAYLMLFSQTTHAGVFDFFDKPDRAQEIIDNIISPSEQKTNIQNLLVAASNEMNARLIKYEAKYTIKPNILNQTNYKINQEDLNITGNATILTPSNNYLVCKISLSENYAEAYATETLNLKKFFYRPIILSDCKR